jgi:hypothetical protein
MMSAKCDVLDPSDIIDGYKVTRRGSRERGSDRSHWYWHGCCVLQITIAAIPNTWIQWW